jgi:peptide/nickel transport system substrate-binding protein
MNEDQTPVEALARRLSDGSLTRRELVQRAAALGLSAPAISALLARTASAAPASPDRKVSSRFQADANTLVIADALVAAPWLTLDPGNFYEINPGAAMNLTVEPLYELLDSTKPDQFTPLLAADMPEVSTDGKEATIKLRTGVKFHSGNDFTADDVVFSWTRLKNIKFQGAFLATDYWESVEAVDASTIKLTLKAPNAALVPILSSMPLAIVDSKLLKEHGGTDAEDADKTDKGLDWINEGNAVGSGPYKLTAWDTGSEVVLEKHTGYWGEAPKLDRIIWRNIEDPNSQLQAVQAGEADIAYSLDPDAAESVKQDPNLQVISGPTLAHEYLALNNREDPGGPLAKKEVRQAIGYAIDYDGIVNDILKGAGIKPATVAPEPLIGTESVHDLGYKQDLAKAQELFDGAGVGPVELTLSFNAGGQGEGGVDLETLATKLQSDLQQIDGLTVKLKPADPATRLQEYREGKLQFTLSGWTPDFPDIHSYAEPFGRTDTAAAKRVGYSNPQVDTWLDEGIAESDPAKRETLYANVLKALIEDAPFLVLYQPVDQKAASKAVQGVSTHSIYMLQLRGASKSA